MAARWSRTAAATLLPLLIAATGVTVIEQQTQTIKLKAFSECEDRGTDELRFSVSCHDGLYSGSIIFKRPLNSSVQAVTEISRWMNRTNEWGRTFHVHRIPDACSGTKSLIPNFARSIADCIGIDGGCPIPAGEYTAENCDLKLGNTTRKLPIGEFRLTVALRNITHVLGRFYMVVEVANSKPESVD